MPIDNEYNEIKKRMLLRTLASDIIYSLPQIGFWVKDMNFTFLDISEKASDILYGLSSNECVGYTDAEIARKAGIEMSLEMFVEVCRGSDIWVLDNPDQGQYKVTTFIEFITDIRGERHIWKTIKGVYPDTVGKERYVYGFALFMNEIKGGYENAYKWFVENEPYLEKLNHCLYRYK